MTLQMERVIGLRLDLIKRLRKQFAELEARIEQAKTESLRLGANRNDDEVLWCWVANKLHLLDTIDTIEPFIEQWKELYEASD